VVRSALDNTTLVGLDLETTGLNPRSDQVRLLSLSLDTIDGGSFCYLVDCFTVNATLLFPHLADKELVLHNAAFDLAFLNRLGFPPGVKVHDTMLLAQLLAAGTADKCSLEATVERELKRKIDKGLQKSNWSGALTEEHLRYAADDAAVLVPLYQALAAKIKAAKLTPVAEIEQRCLPALVWTAANGVAFNRQRWESLAATARTESKRLLTELDAVAPARPGYLRLRLAALRGQ
jgi:DNA polymerase-1